MGNPYLKGSIYVLAVVRPLLEAGLGLRLARYRWGRAQASMIIFGAFLVSAATLLGVIWWDREFQRTVGQIPYPESVAPFVLLAFHLGVGVGLVFRDRFRSLQEFTEGRR